MESKLKSTPFTRAYNRAFIIYEYHRVRAYKSTLGGVKYSFHMQKIKKAKSLIKKIIPNL